MTRIFMSNNVILDEIQQWVGLGGSPLGGKTVTNNLDTSQYRASATPAHDPFKVGDQDEEYIAISNSSTTIWPEACSSTIRAGVSLGKGASATVPGSAIARSSSWVL